jgi:GTP-binding protein
MGARNMADLYKYISVKKYKAPDGKKGENFQKEGAAGEDVVLKVPLGTVITDIETKNTFEVMDVGKQYFLASGGKGGKGNIAFATATNRTPKMAEPGEKGVQKQYRLVLKLIADFGLIGLPNAGKSSLLNELTAAKVKTAMYPFTTLEPNLGVFQDYIIADIPGLIEGASTGKGLGIKFLKHIEKVKVLLHCVAADSKDIISDYETVLKEMSQYNEELLTKKKVILVTKSDLVDKTELEKKIQTMKKYSDTVSSVSIYNPQEFEELKKLLFTLV